MSSVSPKLPPELDGYLMSFLADDPSSLRVCALTCRAWLAASRVVLFYEVKIETEDQYDKFEATILSSPFIQECVRILRLDRSARRLKYALNFPWINNKLSPTLPSLLTRCHTLVFHTIDEIWKEKSFLHLRKFTSVTKLSLIKCQMSPHELYTLIDSFTNLKDFHLENFIEVFRSGTFSISGPPPIPEFKLDSLALIAEDLPRGNPYSSSKDTFFEWISKTQCPLTLKKLKLLIGKRDIQDRAQFLSMLQNRVEDLEILFVRRFGYNISDGQHESEMIANTINLGLNPGLKSLTLPDPANPAVCPLLSQVASPDIQTITFRIPIYRLEDMKRIDSHQLTRVLSARNMATVSEVRFLYTGSFAYDDVYATFKELLPEVAQKGILRVGQVAVAA